MKGVIEAIGKFFYKFLKKKESFYHSLDKSEGKKILFLLTCMKPVAFIAAFTFSDSFKTQLLIFTGYLSMVPKYDGFTCIPNHIDFKKEHHGSYNIYSPLSFVPKEGSIDKTLHFLEHIFGCQKELGLDYMQLLYVRTIQILPILCLVSLERSTGKSSSLKWLKEIFENNLTYLTNDSFGSQFNAD